MYLIKTVLFIIGVLGSGSAFCQSPDSYPVEYISEADRNLTLKTIAVAPTYDNANGIYKRAADPKIYELINRDHLWVPGSFVVGRDIEGFYQQPDFFDKEPRLVRGILENSKADGLLVPIVLKSSTGMTVALTLFTRDGLPLVKVAEQSKSAFSTSQLNAMLTRLYRDLKKRLPFSGMIASRNGEKVTINLGYTDGFKVNDQLRVAHIVKIRRHPKHQFMIGVEKEIVGRVILTKVDSHLSFGDIQYEKERGVIKTGAKLLPLDHVIYGMGQEITDSGEWLPKEPPQYGKVSLGLGITQHEYSAALKSTGTPFGAKEKWAPTFRLAAELWLTQEWFGQLAIEQSFFKSGHGLAGSSPSTLNFTTHTYDFLLGYRYAVVGHFWGPQLSIGLGYLSKQSRITDTNPVAFPSTEYNTWQIQVGGYFPITENYKKAVGAQVKLSLFDKLKETPLSSGNEDTKYSHFSLYYSQQLANHFQLRPEITFSNLSVDFSGAGSHPNALRSLEEKQTVFNLNLEYLF